MKTLLCLAVLSLAVATPAHAALLKPTSTAGRRLVHKIADSATSAFSESMKEHDSNFDCEASKSSMLEELGQLDVSGSTDLASAKAMLEKASCPGSGEPAEIEKSQNRLFAVTAYLRSADVLN